MLAPTRQRWRVILLIGTACLPFGCLPPPPPEPSAGVTAVNPSEVSPGSMVTVTADKAVFQGATTPSITIGGQAATIQSVADPTQAVVIVPNLSPGAAQVRVVEAGKTPGAPGPLTVLSAPVTRLILSFGSNQVNLVSAQPATGGFSENARESGRRLSYDVLDSQGRIIFTGEVIHPTLGRAEVFEPLDQGKFVLRHVAVSPSAAFALKIPNLNGATKVRFHDASADLDLGTAAGRAGRVFLNEISVGG
ncbi:MAG TPA: IPT/TIG domain-containing protein [Phycisphaerae bacterium]|nr:IPT/TIG domain-containing protein [Phycisphaerae bacterium]